MDRPHGRPVRLVAVERGAAELGVRPEDLRLGRVGTAAVVELVEPLGWDALVHLDCGGVALTTRSDGIDARAVVVAAGAWVRGLLAPLGIDLPVVATRETVAYFDLPGAERLPPLIEYPSSVSPLPVGQAYYALPAPGRGLKAGIHHSGADTDPDDEGTPDPAVVDATSTWLARRFPGADTAPSATETCVYTNTADESFVIEAHERIVVASACSGHGFKFAPLHGSVIAALAVEAAG